VRQGGVRNVAELVAKSDGIALLRHRNTQILEHRGESVILELVDQREL
jgi:hypothetical protein